MKYSEKKIVEGFETDAKYSNIVFWDPALVEKKVKLLLKKGNEV